QVAITVERQVLSWFKQMLQYPEEASGLFVTGGSVANLVALTVARTAKATWDLAEEGVNANNPRLIFYASTEAHFSIDKSIRVLGLGNKSLRKIPVNDQYEINIGLLKQAIDKDRAEGNLPCCALANAGTVNTAAFDPIAEIAELCAKEKLWLHVDGAFGAFAKLSPKFSDRLNGMERADSLAFDLHKWFCMPYDIGCVLIRDPEIHRKTFSAGGAYTAPMGDGLMATDFNFTGLGLQQSRAFRALKAWFLLKEQGIENYRKLIEQNIDQARYLASLIEKQSELEICAPVSLNIVCFRYRFQKHSEETQNELNRKIIAELHNSGIAVPSYTVLNGKFVIRV
ncbi:pyridoxal-dependent decarboxylase, partial [bacterium]|nr:pyridoxal-dependent decarboxylase [bacterium]